MRHCDRSVGVDAGTATIERIVALGAPVYGINTGFGKLASVSIGVRDLATLQRNLVLSHASGVGERLPEHVVRLMLALKIASLAQGASGVRWSTIQRLVDCLVRRLLPVIPAQGSVGASGDLAPLAHMAAALIGVGEISVDGETFAAQTALQRGQRCDRESGEPSTVCLRSPRTIDDPARSQARRR